MQTGQDTRSGAGDSQVRQPDRAWPELQPGLVAALFVFLCLMPLGLAMLRPVAPGAAWETAAAALGLVGLAVMAVQFLTSGRFQAISGRIGIDRIMAFHKTTAWWVLLALLLHPVAYLVPTFVADPALGWERAVAYLTLPHYRTGVIALGALIVLVIGSALRNQLPVRYEVWRVAHLALALAAVFCGLHHAVSVGRFSALGGLNAYWWILGITVVTVIATLYLWRWAWLRGRPWRLASVEKRADRIWELDIQPAPGTPPLRYRAGQFVWITEGARRFPLFDHPFSIADSPARPGLSLIVKEAGDFTSRIGSLAPGTVIGVDGPYGNFTLNDSNDPVLLIAGGAGIAPIMGLLRDLVARGDPRPVRLAYAVGQPQNLVCLAEIAAAESALDLRSLLLSERDAPGFAGAVGRLDRERLGVMMDGLPRARVTAMICGPGPMVTAVSDQLTDLGVPMDRVHYERFDYAEGASRQDRRMARRFRALGAVLIVGILGFVVAMA